MKKFLSVVLSFFMVLWSVRPAAAVGSSEIVWSGAVDALWGTAGNWVGESLPTLSDNAIFQDSGNGNTTIDLGDGLTATSLQFKQQDGEVVASYTIGAGGTGNNALTLTDSGNVTLQESNTNQQTVDANIVLGTDKAEASYWFANDSGAELLIKGTVSGGDGSGTAGTKTLAFYGVGSITVDGIISDGGASSVSLYIGGDGDFILTGANTYTGGTTLGNNTGTLTFSSGSLGSTGTVDFTANGTLQWANGNTDDISSRLKIEDGRTATIDTNGNNVTFAQAFQTGDLATGALTKTGDGTLTLSVANTYQGLTKVEGGILLISDDLALGTADGGTEVESGAELHLTEGVSIGDDLTIDGYNNYAALWSESDDNTWTGNVALVDSDDYAWVGAEVGSSLTITGNVTRADGEDKAVLAVWGHGSTVISGTITGLGDEGGIEQADAGSLTLSGTNNYSGTTWLREGTLNINSATALGTSLLRIGDSDNQYAVAIDNTSGSAVTLTNNNEQEWDFDFTFTGTGDLNLGTGGVLLDSDIKVTAESGTLTVGGVIDDDGNGYGINKAGNGTLLLTGENIYSGTTTVSGGTLQIGDGTQGSLNDGDVTDLEFADAGGTISFNEAADVDQDMGTLTLNGGDGVIRSIYAGSGTDSTILTFAAMDSRAIGATGNFVVSGDGVNGVTHKIVLSGVPGGSFDKGVFFGGSSYAIVDDGGYLRALEYGEDDDTATVGATESMASVDHQQMTGEVSEQETGTFTTLNIVGASDLTLAEGATLTVDGVLKSGAGLSTISGGDGIQAGDGAEMVIRTDTANDALTINTAILANGINALTKSGAGTLTLNGDLEYTGQTTVNAGTLNLNTDLVSSSCLFLAGGTVNVADEVNISTDIEAAEGAGTLTFLGSSTIGSLEAGRSIGENGNALGIVNVNGDSDSIVTVYGDIYAYDVNVGAGTLQLNGTFYNPEAEDEPETLNFTADGNVRLADGERIEHNITTDNDGQGTLTFEGSGDVYRQIGEDGAYLKAINITNGEYAVNLGTSDLDSSEDTETYAPVYTNTLNFVGESDGSAYVDFYGEAHIGQADVDDDGITTETDGRGYVYFEGDAVIMGDVGSTDKAIEAINLYNPGASLYLGGNVYSSEGSLTTIYLNSDDQFVEVADGKNIDAEIIANGQRSVLTYLGSTVVSEPVNWDGEEPLESVNFNGGTATLNNSIYAEDVYVKNDATLSVAADAFADNDGEIDGSLTLQDSSILDLGVNTLNVSGTYTQGADTELRVTITDSETFGHITAGTASISSSSTVRVTLDGITLTESQTFAIIDAGSLPDDVSISDLTIIDYSSDWNFAASISENKLILTAVTQDPETYVPPSDATDNGTGVGEALDSITDPDGDMSTILGELDGLRSVPSSYNHAIESLHSNTNGGVFSGMFHMIGQVGGIFARHMEGMRSGINTGETGYAFGDKEKPKTFWMKAMANFMKQGVRAGSTGYSGKTAGTMGGIDWQATDAVRLGWGGGWTQTDVDNEADSGGTLSDSYMGTLYGSYKPEAATWYLDGVLTIGLNRYKGKREISVGAIQREARSDYDGRQYTGLLNGGYDVHLKGGLVLTPLASLQYSHLELDRYDETGAGSVNLSVDRQDYDAFQSGIGVKLMRPVALAATTLTPEVHVKWLREYLQEKMQSTSTFTGGGSSFVTTGAKPERDSYNAGVGLSLARQGDWSLVANYDLELKDQFCSHSGSMTVKLAF